MKLDFDIRGSHRDSRRHVSGGWRIFSRTKRLMSGRWAMWRQSWRGGRLRGRLAEPGVLEECLRLYAQLNELLEKAYMYAKMTLDLDNGSATGQAMTTGR